MMQYIAEIKNVILSLLRYLHRNAWTIIFILAGGYFLFDNCEFCLLLFPPFSHIMYYATHHTYLLSWQIKKSSIH
jgi:hypothetical protein